MLPQIHATTPAEWFTPEELHFFNEGSYIRMYEKFGCHFVIRDGVAGAHFTVWAPGADTVSVIGSFNEWNPDTLPLHRANGSGVWVGFVPGVKQGDTYKYHIRAHSGAYHIDKADPVAFHNEVPPLQASVAWKMDYEWNDAEWMKNRKAKNGHTAPVSIYELHLGSWKRDPQNAFRSLSYREMAPQLADYCSTMGFTHVEMMPVTEHPYYASWGYQTTGFFAATSRYGTPQDFMFLVDELHRAGVGVILDWVPSHFATDAHGLGYFDGTHLYEHADKRQGFHPDWGSLVFNYGRHEVRSFLLSSAMYWLDKFHIDGIRVDAVASMLYLDYSRKEGEWIPNRYGGKENLEAIDFLRRFNVEVYQNYPDVQTYAEESTSWPMVSRPAYIGGLGFGYKWDMGWMHDTLQFAQLDPIFRKFQHNKLTFRMLYAFNENFCMPLSHDEVVHGKGPLYDKMSGDHWRKLAGLRLLYAYQWTMPGKKLLFMGGEFGQTKEWNHDTGLMWQLTEKPDHAGVQTCVKDLNMLYKSNPALHERDHHPDGFTWIDCNDADASVYSYFRKNKKGDEIIVAVLNFTPLVRKDYRIGVPGAGYWREVLNTDAACYGGSNVGNSGGAQSEAMPYHGQPYSINITLPPLGAVIFHGHG